METVEHSRKTRHLTHLPRVGVVKWLSDDTIEVIRLPSVIEESDPLVAGSISRAKKGINSNVEDFVLLGFGYSTEEAHSKANQFLQEQEKCVQRGIDIRDKDTQENENYVLIDGEESHRQVISGPEWDDTLPNLM